MLVGCGVALLVRRSSHPARPRHRRRSRVRSPPSPRTSQTPTTANRGSPSSSARVPWSRVLRWSWENREVPRWRRPARPPLLLAPHDRSTGGAAARQAQGRARPRRRQAGSHRLLRSRACCVRVGRTGKSLDGRRLGWSKTDQDFRRCEGVGASCWRRLGEREVASGVECGHVEEKSWSGVDVPCIGFLGVEIYDLTIYSHILDDCVQGRM